MLYKIHLQNSLWKRKQNLFYNVCCMFLQGMVPTITIFIVRNMGWKTSIHQEVISNLESTHGALLKMNRSIIQADGTFSILKW